MKIKGLTLFLVLAFPSTFYVHAQDNEGYAAERQTATTFALRHLSDRDAVTRQKAAEVLAKFSAVEHQRLVEGYRQQEKNDRVRLALDWALYRMGKMDAVYGVVRGLGSDERRPQAVGYLVQLAGPRPLYIFFDRADPRTLVGLLQVMANIGDSESLELIKPFEGSFEPGVSDSAKFATREISTRISRTPDTHSRPREVRAEDKVGP